MQRKLPGRKSAVTCLLAALVVSAGASADSDSSQSGAKLRWVSPSRTSTPVAGQMTIRALKKSLAEKPRERTSPPELKKLDTASKGAPGLREGSTTNISSSTRNVDNNKWRKPSTVAEPNPTGQNSLESEDQQIPKAPSTGSPFGKWLDAEDMDAEQDSSEPTVSEDAEQNPQVARRLFGNRRISEPPQPPHGSLSFERMHPTERQEDDRKLPKEPPANDLPAPKSDLQEPDSDTDLKPLSSSQIRLRNKIRRVLAHYYTRPLNTRDRSPWEIMHAILSYEVHSKVRRDGPQGEPVTAIGWLCFNQPCKRRTLMYINDESELRVRVGPALQGHRGQLLAMLAWSNVSKDYPMRVEGHDLTVADLVEMEKRTCYPRSELTFKLIGLMHYLPSDAKWTNDQGMSWDLPKIVREESRQSLRDAACGGTHRLTGLTLAYKTRQERGEPIDGAYVQAKQYVSKYKNYAYRLQNGDGSFSTEWFRGPGNEDSIDRKLKTTGHILEWMLFAAEQRDLKSSRITRATNYLANIMNNNRYKDWEAGPLGHAIHALLLYDRLIFAPHDEPGVLPMAFTPTPTKSGVSRSQRSRSQSSRSSSNRTSSSGNRQSSSSRSRR